MRKIDKNFLGGIFRRPDLRSLKGVFKGKTGYLPKEDTIPEDYSGPSFLPPWLPPKIYIMSCIGYC
jgi:hypothetical protein